MEVKKKTERHWHEICLPYDEERYKTIVEKRWDPWKDIPIADISGACQLMRKAAALTYTEGMSNYRKFRLDTRSLELCHLLWEKHPRLIIFYNYDYELAAMKETFAEVDRLDFYSGARRFRVAEWNGHHHEPIPDAERWAYLVQYNAGAEGWNCIQTDAVAFYSQNYSYKMMEQAAGRIDRMNTPYKDLHYYVLKSDAPIDKAVERAIQTKRTFNEKLFMKNWEEKK